MIGSLSGPDVCGGGDRLPSSAITSRYKLPRESGVRVSKSEPNLENNSFLRLTGENKIYKLRIQWVIRPGRDKIKDSLLGQGAKAGEVEKNR